MFTINNFENLHEAFLQLEKQSENQIIIKYMKGNEIIEICAQQFWNEVKQKSKAFIHLNLQGKHVGIIGKNSYKWLVAYCALLNIGSVAVLFNKDYSIEEINEGAKQTDLSALIFDGEGMDGGKKDAIENLTYQPLIKINMNAGDAANGIDDGYGSIEVTCKGKKDDLSCIIFTSGTTGKNKAVMLSNGALIARFFHDVGLEASGCNSQMAIMPFHHLLGFAVAMNALCLGRCLCIGDEPKYVLQYLKCMKPECAAIVPALLDILEKRLKKAEEGSKPLGELKALYCAGAKFHSETLPIFLKWKIDIWQIYGASETCGEGIVCRMNWDSINALGMPSEIIEANIEDRELILKGVTVMLGYYKDKEATNEVLKNGWYHSGDLCRRDEDGYFYLIGRKKNLIILSNGENISPEEIESRLRLCEDVCEVLVREENDFICGEFWPVYPDGSEESEKEKIQERIRAFVQDYNNHVPTYKQIRILKFRDSNFERTAVGKIIRS